MSAEASSLKDEGNEKFKAGDYAGAITAYTRSIELDASQHLCFSNRSGAYLKDRELRKVTLETDPASAELALRDAEECVRLAPAWAKGYSRLATALQVMKRWDEASETCRRSLALVPESDQDVMKKKLDEVEKDHFHHRLKGTWHGTVSEVLGNYDQEFEFFDDNRVRVEVLGRSILGSFAVMNGQDPFHLNVQVPMGEVPAYMPPPPAVPYIARIEGDTLHLCCPYLKMERPTDFTGHGYCKMLRGSLKKEDDAEISKLSRKDRLLRCAQELLDTLPERRLEDVNQSDSEDKAGEKLMAQVRFESSMFAVQKRFGEETIKEVFSAAKSGPDAIVPPELKDAKELRQLTAKLKLCGILDEQGVASSGGPAVQTGPPVSAEPVASKSSSAKVAETRASATKDAAAKGATAVFADLDTKTIGAIAFGCAAVSAVALLLWRRQRQ